MQVTGFGWFPSQAGRVLHETSSGGARECTNLSQATCRGTEKKHQKRKERREEEKKVKPLEDWEVARMQQFSYPTAFPVWGAL